MDFVLISFITVVIANTTIINFLIHSYFLMIILVINLIVTNNKIVKIFNIVKVINFLMKVMMVVYMIITMIVIELLMFIIIKSVSRIKIIMMLVAQVKSSVAFEKVTYYYINFSLIQILIINVMVSALFKDYFNNYPLSDNYFRYFLTTFIKVKGNKINFIIKNLLITNIIVIG